MKSLSSQSPSILRETRRPFLFTLISFIFFVAILYGEDFVCLLTNSAPTWLSLQLEPLEKKWEENLPFSVGKNPEGCDVFSGRWVRDESTRPLYNESECPYIDQQLTCQKHGRPDRDYQYWRWQPHGCDLPRFNETLMLESLRGKRMMYVGDSLTRGQYNSMICLLHRLLPENAKSIDYNGPSIVFRAKDYNATIEFYWAPFLLESNSDNATSHRISNRIIRKGSINKHGRHWKGVDILVFNTYAWWMSSHKMKILLGSFDDEMREIVELSSEDAYRMVMQSMFRWMKMNMNPKTTRVFFTTMSPTHMKSIDWGGEPYHNCYNETSLIRNFSNWRSDIRKSLVQVAREVFDKSKFPITLLNISQLSGYRKDAHVSIYKDQGRPLTHEESTNHASYADCVHWCLPGLQDIWNELLFSKLFYP